jgi:hypothetical protein
MIFIPHQYYSGNETEEDNMDRACDIFRGEETCMQGFGREI